MKVFLKNWLKAIKSRWLWILIACLVWTVLAYLWQLGRNNIFYLVLYYLTGSLLAVDTNNVIGGVIGKSILLLVVSSFFSSIFMHKGSIKVRVHYAKKSFVDGLKKVNAYVASFTAFQSKEVLVIFMGMLGVGGSLIVNAFVTGNATFINSLVNLALFVVCIKQIQEKRGFLIACANVGLKKIGYKEVNGDAVIGLLDGIALGCLLAPLLYLIPIKGTAYIVGLTLFVTGMLCALLTKKGGEANE